MRALIFTVLISFLVNCANKHAIPSTQNWSYDKLFRNEGKWLSQDNVEDLMLEYEKLAAQGDVKAMSRIGYFYDPVYSYLGGRMPRDYQKGKSLYWYKKAANLGDIEAMKQVGEYYEGGVDVEQDLFAAYEWYAKGYQKAPNRFILKMYHLHKEGRGTEKNLDKAAHLLSTAEKLAEKDSQLAKELGNNYGIGINGFPTDKAKAKYWLQKAIDLGDVFSELDLLRIEDSKNTDAKSLDSIARLVQERHKKKAKKN